MKRSVARIIYAVSMLIALIGFCVPIITVDGEGSMNLFKAGVYFNEPGTASLSMFLWVIFIACIFGIASFLAFAHSLAGDVISWLLGFVNGILAMINISAELGTSPFSSMAAGSYITIIGYAAAFVGIILSIKEMAKTE